MGLIADSVGVGDGGSAMAGQPGFFDSDERLKALSAAGDPLERLSQVIDFEVFRGELEAGLLRSDRSKGGRPRETPGGSRLAARASAAGRGCHRARGYRVPLLR
jgi:hypothetical protein